MMDPMHEKKLRKYMPKIAQCISLEELLMHLECLTQVDRERLLARVRNDGNSITVGNDLLPVLRRRKVAYHEFMNALLKIEMEELAQEIDPDWYKEKQQQQPPNDKEHPPVNNPPLPGFSQPPADAYQPLPDDKQLKPSKKHPPPDDNPPLSVDAKFHQSDKHHPTPPLPSDSNKFPPSGYQPRADTILHPGNGNDYARQSDNWPKDLSNVGHVSRQASSAPVENSEDEDEEEPVIIRYDGSNASIVGDVNDFSKTRLPRSVNIPEHEISKNLNVPIPQKELKSKELSLNEGTNVHGIHSSMENNKQQSGGVPVTVKNDNYTESFRTGTVNVQPLRSSNSDKDNILNTEMVVNSNSSQIPNNNTQQSPIHKITTIYMDQIPAPPQIPDPPAVDLTINDRSQNADPEQDRNTAKNVQPRANVVNVQKQVTSRDKNSTSSNNDTSSIELSPYFPPAGTNSSSSAESEQKMYLSNRLTLHPSNYTSDSYNYSSGLLSSNNSHNKKKTTNENVNNSISQGNISSSFEISITDTTGEYSCIKENDGGGLSESVTDRGHYQSGNYEQRSLLAKPPDTVGEENRGGYSEYNVYIPLFAACAAVAVAVYIKNNK